MLASIVLHYSAVAYDVDAPWSRISRFQLTILSLTFRSEKSNAVLAYCTSCTNGNTSQRSAHCIN